jgi:hypothetical protein
MCISLHLRRDGELKVYNFILTRIERDERCGKLPADTFQEVFFMLFRRRTPWKAGILFYDSHDRRIVVPNRFGVGWTLNFANKWAWAIVGAVGAAALYSRHVRTS